MDVSDAIDTRLEVRSYADEPVDDEVKRAVLDAGRLAASGKNSQHWRFVLVDEPERLEELADASSTGGWVAGADFAVAVCTDPSYTYAGIDAGRAVTHMQLLAWERGVGSCIYTLDARDTPDARELLGVPDEYDLTLIAGFGYPDREIEGVKSREPLERVASGETFGASLEL